MRARSARLRWIEAWRLPVISASGRVRFVQVLIGGAILQVDPVELFRIGRLIPFVAQLPAGRAGLARDVDRQDVLAPVRHRIDSQGAGAMIAPRKACSG